MTRRVEIGRTFCKMLIQKIEPGNKPKEIEYHEL